MACRDHASSQSDPGVGRNRFNRQRLFLSESTPRCSASSHSTVDASVRPSRTALGHSSTREPMARKRVSSPVHAWRRERASRFGPIDQRKQVGLLCPGTSAKQTIRQGRTRWDVRLTGARCGSQMGVRGTRSGGCMTQGVQFNSIPMPGPGIPCGCVAASRRRPVSRATYRSSPWASRCACRLDRGSRSSNPCRAARRQPTSVPSV